MPVDESKLRIEFSHGIKEAVFTTKIAFVELMLLLFKKGILTETEYLELINKTFPKESILETQRKKLDKFFKL